MPTLPLSDCSARTRLCILALSAVATGMFAGSRSTRGGIYLSGYGALFFPILREPGEGTGRGRAVGMWRANRKTAIVTLRTAPEARSLLLARPEGGQRKIKLLSNEGILL